MLRRYATWAVVLVVCTAGSALIRSSSAAEPKKPLKSGQFNPAHQTVELFDAMKAGQLEVKVIHKDETAAKILIANKTTQPLNVKLPDAVATAPVLAQIGGGGTGGIGGGLGQSTGGGMGGMGGGGMGGMGGGGGGGMFNIAAERVGELQYAGVCLEHGKPNPRSSMQYELRPIESVAPKPEVAEMLRLFNQGIMSQRVAQVLAWHLNNDMSFEELAAKQVDPLIGAKYPYFTREEIVAAMQAKQYVAKRLEEKAAGEAVVLPKL